jgi:hypothetical protein
MQQQNEADAIGPLGPRPAPADEVIELGRWPIVIEGKQIAEYHDIECQQVRRAYSYAKPETGDELG